MIKAAQLKMESKMRRDIRADPPPEYVGPWREKGFIRSINSKLNYQGWVYTIRSRIIGTLDENDQKYCRKQLRYIVIFQHEENILFF